MKSRGAKLNNFIINATFYMNCCLHTACLQNGLPFVLRRYVDKLMVHLPWLYLMHDYLTSSIQMWKKLPWLAKLLRGIANVQKRETQLKNIFEAAISEFARQS